MKYLMKRIIGREAPNMDMIIHDHIGDQFVAQAVEMSERLPRPRLSLPNGEQAGFLRDAR